jgi:hypothetical protein
MTSRARTLSASSGAGWVLFIPKGTLRHWTAVYFSSCALGAIAGLVFFRDFTHSIDEAAVVIAVPLIVLRILTDFLPSFDSETEQPDVLSQRALGYRIVVRAAATMLLLATLSMLFAISLLWSIPVYMLLALRWTVTPALQLFVGVLLTGAITFGAASLGSTLLVKALHRGANFRRVVRNEYVRVADKLENLAA